VIAVLIRLWRSVGWSGLYGLVVLAIAVGLVAWSIVAHFPFPFRSPPLVLLILMVTIAGSLIGVVIRWGSQQRPTKTLQWEDVVGPLVRSTEEYCLILRPFGADGRIILPHRTRRFSWIAGSFTRTSTLEQVVAVAAKRALGMKTYALVDQQQLLAPPGPVWLRTPTEGDDWQRPVEALIQRAHTIVLILPPGQEIRPSLAWEVRQVTLRDLQGRVLIVLPPPDRHREAYLRAHHQACRVLTALEGVLGDPDDVDELKVAGYEQVIPTQVIGARMSRHPVTGESNAGWWEYKKKRGSRVAVGCIFLRGGLF
jgi:hypothetical protein